MIRTLVSLFIACALTACAAGPVGLNAERYDVIVRGGVVYDGTGAPGVHADVAIRDGQIAAIGDLDTAQADEEIGADGMAVAPGFINLLSQAMDALLIDGRSQSDIRQGVTLEVFGEGWSMGPWNEAMKAEDIRLQQDIRYPVEWTTLSDYLELLARRGVSPNVASFVGATTIRIHELGYANRQADPAELARMQELVREAMRDGALGVGSSLIYAPATYANTNELVALASAAHEFDGAYISHIRNESDHYIEALDELIDIGRRSGARVQMYHMKPAGEANWPLSEAGLARLDAARAAGIDVSANIYLYTAGATGLNASVPPWVQEGGQEAWIARMNEPRIRARLIREMRAAPIGWENLMRAAGGAQNVLLTGFRTDRLKPLTGRTLASVAQERGASVEDTILDLVIEDNSRVEVVYFLMNEENILRNLTWPYTMIGSDAPSQAPEGVFLLRSGHPRGYGNVARLFAHYVRDEHVLTLEEAIRRLTDLPAQQLRLRQRGRLAPGYAADVVVFDPATIQDHATYDQPQLYSTGMRDVLVNGVLVLRDGEHTGAFPGQVVRGPGWTGWGRAQ
ncbi:MAG TPA: amidohydrolase family protein [Verrucomicrobiae bacterium]|nr:amidohydrolase family protein [Verrucomicrobiae bacterium]